MEFSRLSGMAFIRMQVMWFRWEPFCKPGFWHVSSPDGPFGGNACIDDFGNLVKAWAA